MNSLHDDLLTAQAAGYPTGGYSPALQCIFTSKDGGTTYDYSSDPTATTSKLIYVQQTQEKYGDSGVILLQNNDRSVPTDLTGYYVDLGWGLNTASGLKYGTAPRMWVMHQGDISGGPKNAKREIYTQFSMVGVWGCVLNTQPVKLPSSPSTTIPLYRYDESNYIWGIMGKTIYDVLEYLIETTLSIQTGLAFTLDALGTQDDGQISTVVPFPADGDLLRHINADSPWYFQTYGDLIISLLKLTKCVLVPRAGLAFKIVYPQASDEADETYYSSVADGHPFYEVEHRRLNMSPNHIEIFGGLDEVTGLPTVSGHWFDTDHYSGWVSPAETATYTGDFMPVQALGATNGELWETGFQSDAECRTRAAELGWQLKDQILGTRVVVPMDARVEPYDRVRIEDSI